MNLSMSKQTESLEQQGKTSVPTMSGQSIVERINAIICELEMLRAMVTTPVGEPTEKNPADRLFGALGKGTWKEYDNDLDWRRFDI